MPSAPRNHGIWQAQGALVAFLDADDLWTKWKLEDQVAVMQAHPDLSFVYSMARNFGEVNLVSRYTIIPKPSDAALTRDALEDNNPITTSSVLARIDIIKKLGGFDEDPNLKAIEDYDLWLRISECGHIGFIPRVHTLYRVYAGSTVRSIDLLETTDYWKAKRNIKGSAGLQWYVEKKRRPSWRKPFRIFKTITFIIYRLFILITFIFRGKMGRILKKDPPVIIGPFS